jgi:speckle-type POZ protein
MASAPHEFKLNYEDMKDLAIGDEVFSDAFSAGEHLWKFGCSPRRDDKGEYISIFVDLMTRSRFSTSSMKTIFIVISMDKNGEHTALQPLHGDDAAAASSWGCKCVSRAVLEERFLTDDGYITLECSIMVIRAGTIHVPASDIGEHFGTLLDNMDGVDISFTIDSETIHAHKAVLAARSPVFKAELFGSMAEATMSNITLSDIAPSTFKLMLRFI